ncbi:RNA polymerase sigma factor [Tautonia rosea]|uniref:RNA polymerase sigma factor n=1 Tax=Tautonia rosea TaxID=2728037 RepID=UPI001F1E5CB4|nr:sigma factor [Tautonia rosea]
MQSRTLPDRQIAPERGGFLIWKDDASVMSSDAIPERLTELPTDWHLVRTAHEEGPEGREAMRHLIGRYHDAVERYLRLKLRDPNLADEVLQEFWIKLLNHKLAGADNTKGRFRDYLRTVLHRLIIDHFRGRKLQPLPPGELPDPSIPDGEFDRVWREAVIKRVLARLDTYEAQNPKNRYARVLNLRIKSPQASIEELTEQLAQSSREHLSPEAFRKTLQRAREKFVELLESELRDGITHPSQADIEAEIYDLGLGAFYQRYRKKEDR